VADGDHGKMAAVTVASARAAGVTADFHIWTDLPAIEGAIVHPCGTFDKSFYMFKFRFLKDQVSNLHYDNFVFFDADNYFVRDPGDLSMLMQDEKNKVFIPLECVCDPKTSRHTNWWSCPVGEYAGFMRDQGVVSDTFYNTNAGFWIVKKTAINEFCEKTTKVFADAHARGYGACTEEIPLAVAAHTMQDMSQRTMDKTEWLWASDWGVGSWRNRLPKDEAWEFVDFMDDHRRMVKPCITHCMRSKEAMLREYPRLRDGRVAPNAAAAPGLESGWNFANTWPRGADPGAKYISDHQSRGYPPIAWPVAWFLGAGLLIVHHALQSALASNRTLVIADDPHWALVPADEKANWNFYFDTFRSASGVPKFGDQGQPVLCDQTWFPDHGVDLDTWRGDIMRSIFKPTSWAAKRADKGEQGHIVFHIRWTDKIIPNAEGEPIPMDLYFQHAMALRKITGVNDIFICTDSNAALEQALKDNHDFRISHDDERRDVDPYQRFGGLAGEQLANETVGAMQLIYRMQRGRFLIGSNSSCLFKVAYFLRHGVKDNTISLGDNRVFKTMQPVNSTPIIRL
jgi:hypothetical protein